MDNKVSSGGVGIGSVVFIVLLILKITGNIGINWFLVITSFIWAPIIFFVAALIIIGIFYFIAIIISAIIVAIDEAKRKRK